MFREYLRIGGIFEGAEAELGDRPVISVFTGNIPKGRQ